MENKNLRKTHYKKNYLVLFIEKDIAKKRALVNARDEKNAIRIALNQYCKRFPADIVTCVRVGATYENTKKTIEKRIG